MDSKIIDKLRSRGLKCTPQRIDIINEFLNSGKHCTVEALYSNLKQKHPSLSISTVYRTLETLVEIGELRIINVSRFKNYYDKKLEPHHHIVCIKCGKIEDVSINVSCQERCLDEDHRKRYTLIDGICLFNAICEACRLKGVK